MTTANGDVPRLVDHLFRHQAGQIVATLTRILGPRHLDLAEDVVQDALVTALRTWSHRGMPDNPGGWIMQVAKNRALDRLRRETRLHPWSDELLRAIPSPSEPPDNRIEAEWRDDQLGLMFTCCHPSIPRETRIALTLKSLCGFGVPEIARAFLAPEPTIAQRLVRAKRVIAAGDITSRRPPRPKRMNGSTRCWRCSTCCSTRDTAPIAARISSGTICAVRRSA